MILQLRNKKIIIKNNNVPEHVSDVFIAYDFELGTNHLVPKLTINDLTFIGNNIGINIDLNTTKVNMCVELMDTHGNIVKKYEGVYNYYKSCTIGSNTHINIYEELIKLATELQNISEEGELI